MAPQPPPSARASQPASVARRSWPRRQALGGIALLIAFAISWSAAGVRPSALFDGASARAVLEFVRGLFPPDVTPAFLRVVGAAVARTLAIAVAGTAISVLLALPLGVAATATLWHRGILVDAERPLTRRAFAVLSTCTAAALGFVRAIPDLVWGLLFVVAVGLGPLAGALALAVSYAAVLGRVYAHVFEDVDPRPLEALHATGATRMQVFLRGVLPQAAPSATGYTLYSFECCVRAASVLGFIGAGGIAYEINLSMRLFEYGQVLTLIAAFVALVSATDAVSRWLRRRLHANAPPGSLAHEHVDAGSAPAPATWRKLLRAWGPPLVGAIVIVWAFYECGFFGGAFTDPRLLGRMTRFAASMFPPDLDPVFLRSLGVPLVQTLGISVIGTLIGIGIGGVLALPAASTLMLGGEEARRQASRATRVARSTVYRAARLLLALLRSIPELVWVLLCILAVGLGPFAGTLAIGLHTGGVLGKLYAETIEEVPDRPLEALRATGARPLQVLVFGVWPQAQPTLVSYTVLRWEMNLRVSTVLGLVGGGGLGQVIYNDVQLGFHERVMTLILVIYGLVVATEWAGDRLRAPARAASSREGARVVEAVA